MAEVNPKNVLSETTDQENEEDDSHGLKKQERIIQRVSGPKRGKSHKKRQGNDTTHILLHNLFIHLEEEKGKVRSKAKREKRRSPSFSSSVHFLLIP